MDAAADALLVLLSNHTTRPVRHLCDAMVCLSQLACLHKGAAIVPVCLRGTASTVELVPPHVHHRLHHTQIFANSDANVLTCVLAY